MKLWMVSAIPYVSTGVLNLSLTMYPFSMFTHEHVPLKLLLAQKVSKQQKPTEFLIELLYFRIFWNKYFPPSIANLKRTPSDIGVGARKNVPPQS